MIIDRRKFVHGTAILSGSALMPSASWAVGQTEMNDDGLHVQPWFMETFLDLREDHQEAADAGKRFAVIWEQRGCPYCKEMHTVNLSKPKISNYIKENFGVLQLNLWGSRTVTDFDGQELDERDLARKWRVNFTPTIMFFDDEAEDGKTGADLEVARMPGYFKPFHFITMFEYVQQKAYEQFNFQRFLQIKFQEYEAKGIKPNVW